MTVAEPSFHTGLKDYERGTQTWIGQVGHWHVIGKDRRRWIKGSVADCPEVVRIRRVVQPKRTTVR